MPIRLEGLPFFILLRPVGSLSELCRLGAGIGAVSRREAAADLLMTQRLSWAEAVPRTIWKRPAPFLILQISQEGCPCKGTLSTALKTVGRVHLHVGFHDRQASSFWKKMLFMSLGFGTHRTWT